MKKFSLLFIIIFISLNLFAQVDKFGDNDDVVKNDFTFGIRIVPSNYGVVQFFLIKTQSDNTIINTTHISKKSFINQAMGLEKSDANPRKENFFVKYEVFDSIKIMRNVIASIYPIPDNKQTYEYQKRTRFNNQVNFFAEKDVQNLWKLRYAVYPYAGANDSIGWTKNFKNSYMPKPEQMDILKQYGLNSINGFIYGEDFFRLLKDMFMKEWVINYMKAGEEVQNDD